MIKLLKKNIILTSVSYIALLVLNIYGVTSVKASEIQEEIHQNKYKMLGDFKDISYELKDIDFSKYSHILLPKKGISRLSQKELDHIHHCYNAGHIIGLFKPSLSSLKSTHKHLEPNRDSPFANDPNFVSFYATRKRLDGVEYIKFLHSKPLNKSNKDVQNDYFKTIDQWFGDLPTQSSQTKSDPSLKDDPTPYDILQNASKIYNTTRFITDQNIGNFSLTTMYVPVSLQVSLTDSIKQYLYFNQDGIFAPNSSNNVASYTLSSNIVGSSPQTLFLVASSPSTTSGETTTTTGTEQMLEGNIGFSTLEGPNIDIGTSSTISNSSSYESPDVVTLNQSESDTTANNAQWNFEITSGTPLSTNTFQPNMQMLWQTEKSNFQNIEVPLVETQNAPMKFYTGLPWPQYDLNGYPNLLRESIMLREINPADVYGINTAGGTFSFLDQDHSDNTITVTLNPATLFPNPIPNFPNFPNFPKVALTTASIQNSVLYCLLFNNYFNVNSSNGNRFFCDAFYVPFAPDPTFLPS